jgi:translation initiation factor IF-1
LSKDDLIDMQGTVVAVHSGGLYRVQCDAGHEVLAQLSGRMRRFRIKVVPGDRVTVGVSPYDPVRGIITFRAIARRRSLASNTADHETRRPQAARQTITFEFAVAHVTRVACPFVCVLVAGRARARAVSVEIAPLPFASLGWTRACSKACATSASAKRVRFKRP